jgi:hypothetical protein
LDRIAKEHPDQGDRVTLAKFEALLSDNEPAAMKLVDDLTGPGTRVAPYLLLKMANDLARGAEASSTRLHNGIAIAEKANQLTRSPNPLVLAGLAQMYHADRRLSDAARAMKLAVSLVPDTPLNRGSTFVQHLRDLLQQYQNEASVPRSSG